MEVPTTLIREVLRAGEAAADHMEEVEQLHRLVFGRARSDLDAALIKLRPLVYPETAEAHRRTE